MTSTTIAPAISHLETDKLFILATLRRSRSWLNASKISHFTNDTIPLVRVEAALDSLVSNEYSGVCKARYKIHYLYALDTRIDKLPKTATLLVRNGAPVETPKPTAKPHKPVCTRFEDMPAFAPKNTATPTATPIKRLVAPDKFHVVETRFIEAYEVPEYMDGWTLVDSRLIAAGHKMRRFEYQCLVNTCRAVVPFGAFKSFPYRLSDVLEIGF